MSDSKESIGRWISLIYRYGQTYIGKQLQSYSISKGQCIFLIALYKKDGISQEEISEHLKIDKGTTAKAIRKLEKEGYVIRKIDSCDKRAYKVYLAEKALEIKPIIYEAVHNWKNILTLGFTQEESNQAIKILEKMGKNASNFIDFDNTSK